MAGTLSRRVEQVARKTATAVRLDELFNWGLGDFKARMKFAGFLHNEVAIRNAQLCQELRLLPWGLAETTGVQKVLSCYSSYVETMADAPLPQTEEEELNFRGLLNGILEDNTQVVQTIGEGVAEVREALGEEPYEEIRAEMDLILDRFFIKRIGLRFLLQHYVEAAKNRPGASGIIHSNVSVGRILMRSATEAKRLCREKYGEVPEVIVFGSEGNQGSSWPGSSLAGQGGRQFTYVPMHLQFSVDVLLQNACFATAERHLSSAKAGKGMPPVRANYAYGEEEVTVKISDEGGGILRSQEIYAFSYFDGLKGFDSSGGAKPRSWRHSSALGGNVYGAGLPLARLHARYYGGDLVIKPIEGFGTDAHLFLNRLGRNCENLPAGVRVSPAMSDSSVGSVASIRLDDELGVLSQPEVAHLHRRLSEFRGQKMLGDDIHNLRSVIGV